jgi:hypothetical protein
VPHLGHALVGLGIGVATSGVPRTRAVRSTWLGACVLLACLPDVLEWGLRWLRWPLPHNAPASLLVLGILSLALVVGCRLMGERRWGVAGAAVACLASHSLLDTVDGGIPLWWPWSDADVGPDWLRTEAGGGALGALAWEAALFFPVVLLGACARAVRRPPRHPRPLWLLNAVPLLPLALLAGAEGYAHHHMRVGRELDLRGEHERALERFLAVQQVHPLDLEEDAHSWIAMSLQKLGQERAAYELYQDYLARDPNALPMRYGLAYLHLHARDPELLRLQHGLRMMEQVHADAPPGAYREMVRSLLELERGRLAAGGLLP